MRRAKLLVGMVTVLALVGGVAAPAGASVHGGLAFHGWAVVGPIANPVSAHTLTPWPNAKKGAAIPFVFGAGDKKPDPKGILSVCLGDALSPKKGIDEPEILCTINAGGNVLPLLGAGPWCGWASGVGAGSIEFYFTHPGIKKVIDIQFSFLSLGPNLLVMGDAFKGAQTGRFALVADIAPDATNSSCLAKSNPVHFRLTGAAEFVVVGAK